MSTSEEPVAEETSTAGPPSRRRRILRIVGISALALVLILALGVVFLYRHLNGNMIVDDLGDQLGDRPTRAVPSGPINVLVMGSDDRDAPGNNIDNLTGNGKRSDTTILFHLSADHTRAYGVSIPRDSIVDRPDCRTPDGERIPGGEDVMWNEAFDVGGAACTITQFEALTDVYVDHYVIVDFAGFEGMVDAIGGVQVCIPDPIQDPEHGINIPAGTRKLEGRQALNYVRARYTVADQSDLSRIKRQQAFVASMAHEVLARGMLARPDRLVRFLDAATSSLTTDIDSVWSLAKVGSGFRDIGFDHITFVTVPNEYYPSDSEFRGRVRWLPTSADLWEGIAQDEELPAKLTEEAITARHAGGNAKPGGGKGGGDPDDDGLCG